jgi:hypothetical protein
MILGVYQISAESHVSKGQLPDLGKQIDYLKKSGTGDDNIVALFFSKGK